jgi:protein-S-isoprenylcysteine O-methyltransferase Ste14
MLYPQYPHLIYEYILFWNATTIKVDWIKSIGAIFLVIYTGFTLWARIVLGKMWSMIAAVKEGHTLRIDGPFGLVRHPIYAGILGMLLGTMLLEGFGQWVLFFIVALITFMNRMFAEERMMIKTFGMEYEEYMRRVPRLFPRLNWMKRNS